MAWLPDEQVMSRLKAYAASQPPGSIVLKCEPEKNAIYLEGVRFEFRNGKRCKRHVRDSSLFLS